MLSGETAKGEYPTEAVSIMAKIARDAEGATFNKQVRIDFITTILSLCIKTLRYNLS